MGARRIDETGKAYGRLIVLGEGGLARSGDIMWRCRCSCGAETVVVGQLLRRGKTVSCGCFGREAARRANVTHGLSKSPTWSTWRAMHGRCEDPANAGYSRYGALGIRVCAQWKSFSGFLADMGVRPAGKTLDRVENSGNYEPSNCRWATPTEQQANTRRTRKVEAFGQVLTLSEWARRFDQHPRTIGKRLDKGWAPELALSTRCKRGG